MKKKSRYEKNPDNSDTNGCSRVVISISNRLRMLPETLPDIHPPNQLSRSSEIGPFEDQCSAAWVHAPTSFPRSTFTGRALVFEWTYPRAPWELGGRMGIRESLWEYSKSIGDAYDDPRAANRVGIVRNFFSYLDFFFIQTGKYAWEPRPRSVGLAMS